jgi:hypothetical protein
MTASTIAAPRFPRAAGIAVTAWLALALVAGATGFLARLPFPGPQLIFVALFAATLIVATGVPAVRAWVDALPLRTLIGINALRFIGVTFLVLAARGQMAPVFAARAGWGDIATALLALMLVAAGEPRTPLQRGLTHAWNVFGFLDLVVAVVTATAVTLQGSSPGVAPVLYLPLVLVPTFFVPIILANHVIIFRRLRAVARTTHGA